MKIYSVSRGRARVGRSPVSFSPARSARPWRGFMQEGDTAAGRELRALVPDAECAEVKSGVSRTAGFMLPHSAACTLIREKCRHALERLAEFKPYQVSEPVEIKVEYTTAGTKEFP